MVFLMETMVEDKKLEIVRSRCGFDSGLCFSSVGNSGGLGFWWRDREICLVSYSNHHIMVKVLEADESRFWFACGIYGWADRSQNFQTWDLMRSLRSSVKGSCLFFGDFNEITCSNEKYGGACRGDKEMKAFRDCISDCCLRDLGYRGSNFTWRRGKTHTTLI